MATPSKKHFAIDKLLGDISGSDRRVTITGNVCVLPPIGCGGPATEFRDELSKKEYRISGLCQKCQDSFFGG